MAQVSSLQQQVKEAQKSVDTSSTAHQQIADQLKVALDEKCLLEQQLDTVALIGQAGDELLHSTIIPISVRLTVVTFFPGHGSMNAVLVACKHMACCMHYLPRLCHQLNLSPAGSILAQAMDGGVID